MTAGPTHDLRRLWGRGRGGGQPPVQEPLTVVEAASRAVEDPRGPKDGIVAVKVRSLCSRSSPPLHDQDQANEVVVAVSRGVHETEATLKCSCRHAASSIRDRLDLLGVQFVLPSSLFSL